MFKSNKTVENLSQTLEVGSKFQHNGRVLTVTEILSSDMKSSQIRATDGKKSQFISFKH